MSPKLKKVLRLSVLAGGVVGIGLQLVPVKGVNSNPAEHYKVPVPPVVEAIMRRACFDCHTNETKWPLYSRIAPGSWLMARDVNNGRKHLNFSEWAETDDEERTLDFENCWSQVESGEMPPWFYIFPMHPKARLSQADKAILKAWFIKDKPGAAPGPAAPAGGANDAPAVASQGDMHGSAGDKVATGAKVEAGAKTAKP
jgi:hypothetical protein